MCNEMSSDRVEFYLPGYYVNGKAGGNGYRTTHFNSDKMLEVLYACFNISENEYEQKKDSAGGLHIICRPSQFARFLIARNDAGINNGFKDLNPALYKPETQTVKTAEVSTRKNYYWNRS